LQEALEIAEKFRFPVRVVRTAEFENPDYLSNPVNRCYFCKHELFGQLAPIARAEKFAVIAYGENASDNGDFRPGAQAAAEFQVRAPLKEVGLTKSESASCRPNSVCRRRTNRKWPASARASLRRVGDAGKAADD